MTTALRDKKIMWHPFTQEKTAPEVINITRASGSYLYDENENAYLDLVSSWWVTLHGHGHPHIAKSIYEQAKTVEHVMFAGFTHEPAITLCESLQTLLPPELSRFFFSDNGSTSVEIALKMAYQYWQNIGMKEKKYFLSFEGGYHGDTFGAMSAGARSGYHTQFEALFFRSFSIPYPDTWEGDMDIETKEKNALHSLSNYVDQYHNEIAAIILEPLIQGASGMRMCRHQFIKDVLSLLKPYNILVIFDEVMTGFCRTGTYFALDQLECIPDFLCLSKGITGGFLPLALTITKNKIYEAFLDDDFKTAFAHGHSYTANPIACSAAITSLKLLKNPKCQEAIKRIHQAHKAGRMSLKAHCSRIEKIRVMGTIAAFDIKEDDFSKDRAKKLFLEEGLLLRPLGRTVYLIPPYCITDEEINQAYIKIARTINSL